jgi:hypothetical protein
MEAQMLNELTASVRRWAGLTANDPIVAAAPLIRVGGTPAEAMAMAQTDIESLRGLTPAAADTAPCTCPDSCERDHANE